MIDFQDYRDFLQSELSKRIDINSNYSQRAFARDLNLSPGELSEILRGKRKLSHKKALKISSQLALSQIERNHFVGLLTNDILDTNETSPNELMRRELELDLFQIVSDWYCFAILNLSECEGFRWNYNWIGKHLDISPVQAKIAIERMVRVGLIEVVNGRFKECEDFVLSPDGISSQAVREYHHQLLTKADSALFTQNINDRDITGMGFAVNPSDLPKIKKEIATFSEELVQKYSKNKKTRVYQLQIALFQLTQGDTNV